LDVIRGGSSGGREDGSRELFVPSQVNENPIKAFKRRVAALVGPSETLVKEGKLDQAHGIDTIVKSLYLRHTEIWVVVLVSVSDHVEIAAQHPWGVMALNASLLGMTSRPARRMVGSVLKTYTFRIDAFS
jgi:hypothetical protein